MLRVHKQVYSGVPALLRRRAFEFGCALENRRPDSCIHDCKNRHVDSTLIHVSRVHTGASGRDCAGTHDSAGGVSTQSFEPKSSAFHAALW